MTKDELKDKAENLKGRVKEAFGALTGDKKAQAESEIDRAKFFMLLEGIDLRSA